MKWQFHCNVKFNKMMLNFVGIYLSMLVILGIGMQYLHSTVNASLIERFGDWTTMYIETAVALFFLLCIITVVATYWRKETLPKRIFFCVYIVFLLVFIFAAFLSHGESFRTIFVPDKKDTFMDFFNSMQYGLSPYKNKVIYPPLINLIFAFLGKFVLISGITDHAYYMRDSQMGHILFALCSVIVIICLSLVFLKLQKGDLGSRILLCVLLFLSVPFLFLLERGNSLFLAIVFVSFFLLYYRDSRRWMRWIAYASLGAAAGIKIVPALLGVLIIRERSWKDVRDAILIGSAVFFLPFCLMDGGPFDLFSNIRYTTSLMQGVIIIGGIPYLVGTGVYVNFSNTVVFLGRLWNFDGYPVGEAMGKFILLGGIILAGYVRNFSKWKVVALLCSLMILSPGFSAIYNLAYMSLPLILFLNQGQMKKMDIIYLMLFLGMFVPVVNFKVSFLALFFEDINPARITTVLESFSLLFLTLLLEGEMALAAFQQFRQCGYCEKGAVVALVLGAFFVSVHPVLQPHSVEAAYPTQCGLYLASNGISTLNGLYSFVQNGATLTLDTEKLNKEGLLVRLKGLEETSAGEVHLFLGNQEVGKARFNGKDGVCLFVEPDVVSAMAAEKQTVCRVVWDDETVSQVGLVYIGPGRLLSEVSANTYIDEASCGLFRLYRQQNLWMGKQAVILLDTATLKNGLFFDYHVPPELFGEQTEEKITLVMTMNGRHIKTMSVTQPGRKRIAISMTELGMSSAEMDQKVMRVGLEINKTFSDAKLGLGEETKERSLLLNFLGDISCFSEPLISSPTFVKNADDIEVGQELFLSTEDLKEKGLTVVYHLPSKHQVLPEQVENELSFWIDGKVVRQKKIVLKERPILGAIYIPKEIFMNAPSIITAELKMKSNESIGLISKSSDSGLKTTVIELRYVGIPFLSNAFDTKDKNAIYWQSTGITWKMRQEVWQMGWNAQILLSAEGVEDGNIVLRYRVPEIVFSANPKKTPHLSIYVNGEKLKDEELKIGAGCIVVPMPPLVHDETGAEKDPILFELRSNTVYNLGKEKLLKEYDDRSIEIESLMIVDR